MLKLIAVASVVLTVVACGGSKSGADTTPMVVAASTATPRPCGDEAAIETVRPSVVRVSTEDGSIGTGIIVAENRVLTNAHVVEGSTTVRVESQSGAVEGSVIGSDSVIDVALIQAPTRDLPVVVWAEPTELRAGQRLLALGYALDLPGEPSSTGGIFSALRTLEGIDYLQTDTPINPGNSGGPLFTQCGEIVGINTFTLADSELNLQGLGFAIRSSVLKSAISDLGSGAYVERPSGVDDATEVPEEMPSAQEPIATQPPAVRPATVPPPAPQVPLEQPPVTAVCGQEIWFEPQAAPFGQSFHDGDVLSVTIQYRAPGCDSAILWFYGRHARNSPWIEFWCPQYPSFCEPHVSTIASSLVVLPSSSGFVTFLANPGVFPPANLGAKPNLEGFSLCGLQAGFKVGDSSLYNPPSLGFGCNDAP